MATTNKTSAKTAKKATKAPAKKTSKKTVKAQVSFRPEREQVPFFTFRITRQSIYWAILSIFILCLGLWVVKLHIEVQDILNKIEENEAASASLVLPVTEEPATE